MTSNNPDYMPVEIELSRAVDRLEQHPEQVGDWTMVLETLARIEWLKLPAELCVLLDRHKRDVA